MTFTGSRRQQGGLLNEPGLISCTPVPGNGASLPELFFSHKVADQAGIGISGGDYLEVAITFAILIVPLPPGRNAPESAFL